MSVLGIIAEYNPFHNGHLYHMSASKSSISASKVIVVMSGNFTQRGDSAICDKFSRTRMALKNGADIVVELPVFYAVSSAEYFSWAAVKLMDAMGVVTHLSFGSESGDLEQIRLVASAMNKHRDSISWMTSELMSDGLPYFKAREHSLSSILHICQDFIRQPNHILAIEYTRALEEINSSITPVTIKREGLDHYKTASSLRQYIKTGDYPSLGEAIPDNVFFLLLGQISKYGAADISRLDNVLFYLLRTKSLDEIKSIYGMNDGVAERMVKLCGLHDSSEGFLNAVKTKRYAHTRLRRAIAHLLLDIKSEMFDQFNLTGGPRYIRVLGFRKDASQLLGEMVNKASLPVIMNLPQASDVLDETGLLMLNKDIQSTDLYYLACKNKNNTHGRNREYYQKIVKV